MTNIPHGRAGLNAMYGNPTKNGKLDPAWQAANIVGMPIPFPAPFNKMRIAWEPGTVTRKLWVHKAVVDDLTAIFTEIWNEARRRVKASDIRPDGEVTTAEYDTLTMSLLRKLGLDLWGGGFNYRLKRGGSTLSVHSWGVAIDLDPARNGMGDTTPAMPLWVVEIFEARGWVWGGRWKGKNCDGMHFQRCTGY